MQPTLMSMHYLFLRLQKKMRQPKIGISPRGPDCVGSKDYVEIGTPQTLKLPRLADCTGKASRWKQLLSATT